MFVIKAAESDIADIGDLNPELSHQHCLILLDQLDYGQRMYTDDSDVVALLKRCCPAEVDLK